MTPMMTDPDRHEALTAAAGCLREIGGEIERVTSERDALIRWVAANAGHILFFREPTVPDDPVWVARRGPNDHVAGDDPASVIRSAAGITEGSCEAIIEAGGVKAENARLYRLSEHLRSQWTSLLAATLGDLNFERATAQAEARVSHAIQAFQGNDTDA